MSVVVLTPLRSQRLRIVLLAAGCAGRAVPAAGGEEGGEALRPTIAEEQELLARSPRSDSAGLRPVRAPRTARPAGTRHRKCTLYNKHKAPSA